ncbi:hypothetical protein V8C44DRAFT_79967 [Trichoderma aethiopicum]
MRFRSCIISSLSAPKIKGRRLTTPGRNFMPAGPSMDVALRQAGPSSPPDADPSSQAIRHAKHDPSRCLFSHLLHVTCIFAFYVPWVPILSPLKYYYHAVAVLCDHHPPPSERHKSQDVAKLMAKDGPCQGEAARLSALLRVLGGAKVWFCGSKLAPSTETGRVGVSVSLSLQYTVLRGKRLVLDPRSLAQQNTHSSGDDLCFFLPLHSLIDCYNYREAPKNNDEEIGKRRRIEHVDWGLTCIRHCDGIGN